MHGALLSSVALVGLYRSAATYCPFSVGNLTDTMSILPQSCRKQLAKTALKSMTNTDTNRHILALSLYQGFFASAAPAASQAFTFFAFIV